MILISYTVCGLSPVTANSVPSTSLISSYEVPGEYLRRYCIMYDSMVLAESSSAGTQFNRADVAVVSVTWTFVGALGMAANKTNKL